MLKKIMRPLVGVAGLALLAAVAVPTVQAAADHYQEEDEKKVKKVRVKKIEIDCEGEEGEDCKDGKRVIVIRGGGGKHGIHRLHRLHHEDCEGEDCEHEGHRIVVGGPGMKWVERFGDEMGEMGENFSFAFAGHGGAFLGVQLTDLTPELRAHFGVGEDEGVMVAKVVGEGPAAKAGIAVGDVITSVDGRSVKGAGSLSRKIRGYEAGDMVEIGLSRDGAAQTVSATLEERHATRGWPRAHRFDFDCDEDEEDCDVRIGYLGDGAHRFNFDFNHDFDFDCGDAEDCRIEVDCEDDGECECTANGETIDCGDLPGFSEHHGDQEGE